LTATSKRSAAATRPRRSRSSGACEDAIAHHGATRCCRFPASGGGS
jgi:hypothetical protein